MSAPGHYLSRAQDDELFSNFKAPLHRVNNPNCCDCFAFRDNGYVISKKAAGAGRRVGGLAATTPVPPAPVPPAPAPAPVIAPVAPAPANIAPAAPAAAATPSSALDIA